MKNEYGAATVSQYDYLYDNIGRRKTMTTSGDAFSISLPVPPDQKLINTGTYTSVGYTANDLNQYTSVETNGAAASPAYDNDGGLTDDGTFTYTWNGENRLSAVTPKTPAVGDKKLDFIYDYMGRRAQKVTTVWDGAAWQSDETRFFVYDGLNLIEELDGAGAVTASYVYGLDISQSFQGAGGIGGILARIDHGVNKSHIYFYDANGNVGQLVDSLDGYVVAAYEYAPFGGLVSGMGNYAEANPFRFSTKYADDVAGLYYYGYRYYSPELGRWMSRDPIGEEGGLNLYGFVGGNPLNVVDFFGLCLWSPGKVDSSDGLSYLEGARRYFFGGGDVDVPFSAVDPNFGVEKFINSCSYSVGKYNIDTTVGHQLYSNGSFFSNAGPGRIVLRLKGSLTVTKNCGCKEWTFAGYTGAYTDAFDFDPRPWGERKWYNELVTRDIAMLPFGNSFDVNFIGQRNILVSGACN